MSVVFWARESPISKGELRWAKKRLTDYHKLYRRVIGKTQFVISYEVYEWWRDFAETPERD